MRADDPHGAASQVENGSGSEVGIRIRIVGRRRQRDDENQRNCQMDSRKQSHHTHCPDRHIGGGWVGYHSSSGNSGRW